MAQAAQKRRQSRSVGDIAHDQVVIPDHAALRAPVQQMFLPFSQQHLIHVGAVPFVMHTDSPSFLSGVFSPYYTFCRGKCKLPFRW